jgi:hypothetical protein
MTEDLFWTIYAAGLISMIVLATAYLTYRGRPLEDENLFGIVFVAVIWPILMPFLLGAGLGKLARLHLRIGRD